MDGLAGVVAAALPEVPGSVIMLDDACPAHSRGRGHRTGGKDDEMEIKCLEIRDRNTSIPVICIRPVAENAGQRYLLRRDGYRADNTEHCIIMIDAQCRGVSYDPFNWVADPRTKPQAHFYIEQHWGAEGW